MLPRGLGGLRFQAVPVGRSKMPWGRRQRSNNCHGAHEQAAIHLAVIEDFDADMPSWDHFAGYLSPCCLGYLVARSWFHGLV